MAQDIDGHLRLVVTPSVSGTQARWLCEVYSVVWGWNDSQAINWSDAVSGSYAYTASAPGSSSALLASTLVTKAGVPGGSYNLDVNVSGAYDGSAPSLANVNVTIPVAKPSQPGNPTFSLITGTSFRASWAATADWGGNTGTYRVRISSDGFATYTEHTVAAGTLYKDFVGLGNGTDYDVRVYAYNSAGYSTTYGSGSTTTLVVAPGKPGTSSVSSITATSFASTWPAPTDWGGENTGNYEVEVKAGAFTGTGLVSRTVPNYTPTGLTPGTSYNERHRAVNSAGPGPWSDTRTTLLLPGQVGSVSASAVGPTGFTLGWAAVASATQYRVQVATDAGFTDLVVDAYQTSLTRAVTGLDPATRYYRRVYAINAAGVGAWSATQYTDTLAGSYVWNGSTWLEATPYVWNGSAWVLCTPKVWAGVWK